MERWRGFFLVLVALVLFSEVVFGVDRSKFKRCDQAGFCKRNRALSESDLLSPYTLAENFDLSTPSSLKGSIRDDLDSDTTEKPAPRFALEVIAYAKDVIRVRVTESEPLIPRYEPADVLLPDIKQVGFTYFNKSTATSGFALGFGPGKELRVSKAGEPLRFDFYLDGELAISANERGLFSFEHTRPKPATTGRQLLEEEVKVQEEAAGEAKEEEETPYNEEPPLSEGEKEELDEELQDVTDEAVLERKTAEWNEKGERRSDHLHPETHQEEPKEETTGPHTRELLQVNSRYKRVNSDIQGWEEHFSSHKDPKEHGPQSVALDFTFHGTKFLYGIPEHASSLALKDTKKAYDEPYRLYNLDVFEYELDVPMALYGAVPFVVSISEKRSTGLFWLNPSETWIDVSTAESESDTKTHWISESGIIDFFVFLGDEPKDVLSQFASLVGTSPVPQYSAIAYHQCRWNYKDQHDVALVDSGFDEHDIPYDFIWLDIEHTAEKKYFTWDSRYFPDPIDMITKIASKGRKMVTIIDPHLKRDNNYHVYSEAHEKGYYVKKNSHDSSDYEGWCWPGSSSWLDYLNPEVRAYWASKFQFSSYVGSTEDLFTWNDMNEPSVFNGPEVTMHKDAYHYGGFEHRDVHNIYGFYQHMSTFDGHLVRSSNKQRPFILTRSFFAGSQRYSAVWTGDNAAQWSHLAIAQPMLLSLSISGIVFCGADVGGFFGNPDPELMLRWYQAGIFHPFFRAHAHLETKRREPWLFGEPWTARIRDTIRIRYSLLPYWYTLFQESSTTGAPIMRPIWMEFPRQPEFYNVDDTFLVGNSLLVKPVVQAGSEYVDIHFPGTSETEVWYDFFDYSARAGGVADKIHAPITKIPVFIRGGSILTKKERARRSSTQMVNDPFTFVVALNPKGEAKGRLYLDDGHSFEYSKGNYLEVEYRFENNALISNVVHSPSDPASFEVKNTLERVVVIGLKKSPTQVFLKEDGSSTPKTLTFSYDQQKDVLTVRKPDAHIASKWTINFEF